MNHSGIQFLRQKLPVAALTVSLSLLFLGINPALALEKAVIQLKWLHHFQFAGYYMALEKGFYREAGLDVTIMEGGPTAEVEKDVAAGRADFGTGASSLLLNLARGEDFVSLAQIFQHSPAIFLTPRKTGISTVGAMAGRRFMYANQHGDMRALLKKYGMDEAQIVKVPHQGNPRDLLNGKAEVMLAYSFNEPFILEQTGEPYFSFSPMSFGIDFYGDNLFTTGKMVKSRPEYVKAFRDATLRGWGYALAHKAETVDLILAKYSRGMSREHLLFEADQMDTLIQPIMVELGYQSLSRWKRISETYAEVGMLPKGFDASPIIYSPAQRSDYMPLLAVMLVSVVIISFLSWLALTFLRLNKRLKEQIEERKQSELNLRYSLEEAQRFRTALDNIDSYIYMKDKQSCYVYANRSTLELFGCSAEELIGCDDTRFFPSETVKRLVEIEKQVFSGKQTKEEVDVADAEGGRRVYFEVRTPIYEQNDTRKIWGLLGISTEITERKQADEERHNLERQMLQTQKLESLGILAGGIAHDFNNILMAIMGNADLALIKLKPESPVVPNLRKIEQAAKRAAELAKQMLAYSGRGKFLIENLELNSLLNDMLPMLEVSISKKIVMQLNLTPHLPTVEADATQICQVIMNLVINASEAIGDENGVIAISTGSMECDQKAIRLSNNFSEGVYVYLEITDSGCGMNKETLSKIFDPFFTTKFTGRGLGMAAVQGIIRGHKGVINVDSDPGRGTTFRLLLPAGKRPAESMSNSSQNDDWQGKGTVLLVDDEEMVRCVGAEMLKALDFTVITANDGVCAVEVFKSRNDIDFVILDLTMPNMDGEECFQELRQLNLEVKVIMSSGYCEQEVTQKFIGMGVAGFVQKPYTFSALKEVLKGVV